MEAFLEKHSGELFILALFALITLALLVLVPQLLRAHLRTVEISHAENVRVLEQGGEPLSAGDERSRHAGRTVMLVPMVVICAAGTVTCFLIAYRSEYLFLLAVAVWVVSGLVSLAAILGGVALVGRLAQLNTGQQRRRSGHG